MFLQFYIELSKHLIYIAYRTTIHCFDIRTGDLLGCIPPTEPLKSLPQLRAPSNSRLWTAVHREHAFKDLFEEESHELPDDSRGNLVAISHTGALMWCRDIGILSCNKPEAILNSIQHLHLGVSLTQLAVENGHCTFVSERNVRCDDHIKNELIR